MKRKLKYAAVAAFLCGVLLFLAYPGYLSCYIDPFFSRWQSRRLLAAASTPEELQAAVGGLGAFYTFPDGSWLAIRYRDSHTCGIWSVAVARDSGGNWYESREHFCGAFVVRRNYRALEASLGECLRPEDGRGGWLYDLVLSPDLATVRQRMTSRYFTQLP